VLLVEDSIFKMLEHMETTKSKSAHCAWIGKCIVKVC
jgi:hypothetical protein